MSTPEDGQAWVLVAASDVDHAELLLDRRTGEVTRLDPQEPERGVLLSREEPYSFTTGRSEARPQKASARSEASRTFAWRIGRSMPSTPSLPLLARARERLCDHAAHPVPLDTLAREAGMSTFQFIRRFHAMFGETPHQMRLRLRLEAAKRLLVLDGESVTETCLAVGFASLGSFSHLFSQRYGEPPSAYRRRLLAIPGWSPALLVPHCVSLMNAAFATGTALQFPRSAAPGAPAESKALPATSAGRIRQE